MVLLRLAGYWLAGWPTTDKNHKNSHQEATKKLRLLASQLAKKQGSNSCLKERLQQFARRQLVLTSCSNRNDCNNK
jgi:hypothetical protein